MDFHIHQFNILDSTNDLAFRMAEDGAPQGTVVIAAEQTAGRGRLGRSWSSPPGTGLYLSLLLRPGKPPNTAWQLAFVASLAAAEAIEATSSLDARIKWPNDVLIGGRKVCGILVETRGSRQMDGDIAVVIGVGVNVNVESFPPEIRGKATSLFLELGYERAVSISTVEGTLLRAFGDRYEEYLRSGFKATLDSWKRMECTTGRHVSVNTPEGQISGIVQEIGNQGELIIHTAGGDVIHLSSGEIFLG